MAIMKYWQLATAITAAAAAFALVAEALPEDWISDVAGTAGILVAASPGLDGSPQPVPLPPPLAPPAAHLSAPPMPAMVAQVRPVTPTAPAVAAVPPAPAAAPDAVNGLPASTTAAKTLFGMAKDPAPLAARAIGFYSRGCLAGAQPLPVDGPEWQTMRLSRNRNWGTPQLVSFIERFADDVRRLDGWPGLLVGDMSQPRGGPMASGHASHQVGLDVDIWFLPMPEQRLTSQQREDVSANDVLAPDKKTVNHAVWSDSHLRLLKRAASFGEVERIFINPAIKKELCEATVHDVDRSWLTKMRPMWGHNDHFHVRIRCPAGMTGCTPQAPVATDNDGCGTELTQWLALVTRPQPPRDPNAPPEPPSHPMTLDKLPTDCRQVLEAHQSKLAHSSLP